MSIPKLAWSFALDYTLGTHAEYDDEHNKLVQSLFHKAGLQYGHAEKLADYIEEWVTEE